MMHSCGMSGFLLMISSSIDWAVNSLEIDLVSIDGLSVPTCGFAFRPSPPSPSREILSPLALDYP